MINGICAAVDWHATGTHAGLAIAAGVISLAIIWGAGRWLRRLRTRLTDATELKPREDAVVIGACFLVSVIGGLYCAAEAAMLFTHTQGSGIFVLLLVSLATLQAGALLGFIFAIPKTTATADLASPKPTQGQALAAAGPAVTLQSSTSLEQIADWLTKIIVGVGLVEAQQIFERFKHATVFLGDAFGTPGRTAQAVAAAILVFFSILGFIGVYLLTRLYIAAALGRAERDMRATSEQKERTRANIAPALFRLLKKKEIRVEDLPPETRTVVDEMNNLDFSSLTKPEDFATWGFAKLAVGDFSDARRALKEAVNVMPNNAECAYAYAVALARSGGSDDEVYKALRDAKDKITAETDRETRDGIYTSLMYRVLYRPGGYKEAIEVADDYRAKFGDLPDDMLVNLACAYGQKASELKAGGAALSSPEIQDARSKALEAIRSALEKDPKWRDRFQLLMYKDYPGKAASPALKLEDDLEIFGEDPEFRKLVGRPQGGGESA